MTLHHLTRLFFGHKAATTARDFAFLVFQRLGGNTRKLFEFYHELLEFGLTGGTRLVPLQRPLVAEGTKGAATGFFQKGNDLAIAGRVDRSKVKRAVAFGVLQIRVGTRFQ
jgi:hypothetical protein